MSTEQNPQKDPAETASAVQPDYLPPPAQSAPVPPPIPQNSNVRGPTPQIPSGAPLYRVTGKPHFINGRVVHPGQGKDSEVRFAGVPGVLLEPLDEAAKKARDAADAEREARRKAEEAERNDTQRLRRLIAKQK